MSRGGLISSIVSLSRSMAEAGQIDGSFGRNSR